MPSRYHPIEDGLWNDCKLEGTPFEEKGFFAFLCSCYHQRPAGIYRATDAQLVADTEIPLKRIKAYLIDLDSRHLIVRDGAWMFVRNYLKRQPKQDRLLLGVQSDVSNCDSIRILECFSEQYPMYSKWSTDRLETVRRPINDIGCTEQLQLQSSYRAEHMSGTRNGDESRGVLDWLNQKAGKNYPASEPNLEMIRCRIKEGTLPEQLKAIISRKVRQWASDERMKMYLRPKTLFNKINVANYLGELPKPIGAPDVNSVS